MDYAWSILFFFLPEYRILKNTFFTPRKSSFKRSTFQEAVKQADSANLKSTENFIYASLPSKVFNWSRNRHKALLLSLLCTAVLENYIIIKCFFLCTESWIEWQNQKFYWNKECCRTIVLERNYEFFLNIWLLHDTRQVSCRLNLLIK